MKQIPYQGSRSITIHHAQFSQHGDLACDVRAPLYKPLQQYRMHAVIMGCKQQKVLDNSDCSGYEFDYGYSVQHSFSYPV